jgi:hypothetical protein
VQQRPHGVDLAWSVTGEQLERKQGRAADRRALVFEPSSQEIRLLAEAELADRAVRGRPLPVVGRARRDLQLVSPFAAEVGELPLVAALRQLVCAGGCLSERQTDASDRSEGPT